MKNGILSEQLAQNLFEEICRIWGQTDYSTYSIEPDKLNEFIKRREFDGLNVVGPYTRRVMPLMAKNSETARRCGSVNTIIKQGDRLFGYNTDYYGITYLLDTRKIDVAGKKCLIIGTGGLSDAIKTVLTDRNAGRVEVIGHTVRGNMLFDADKQTDAEIIINASISGRYPDNGQKPISLEKFSNPEVVIDMVCCPHKSALLEEAEARGARIFNGIPVLASQTGKACAMMRGISDAVGIEDVVCKLMRQTCNISIIGTEESPKDSVGEAVAEKLSKKHYDIDSLIEKMYGRSTEKILRRSGENEYMRSQRVAADWAGKRNGSVISAGKGVVANKNNRFLLAQNGRIILLTNGETDETLGIYRDFCDYEIKFTGSVNETADVIIARIDDELTEIGNKYR